MKVDFVRNAPEQRCKQREQRTSERILFFVNDAHFFLSHRLPIARAALASGMEVHVATPMGLSVHALRQEGFRHHEVPINRWGANPVREVSSFWAIRRVVREVRPALMHNVTIKPVLYGSLAARRVRDLVIVNAVPGLGTVFIRQGRLAAIRRGIVKWLYRRLFRPANVRLILQNPDDLLTFLNEGIIDRNRAVLIRGSGVDLRLFKATPLPSGTPVVMLASRMVWDKGVQEFVEAAETLRKDGVRARFVLVGDSEAGNPAAVPTEQLATWDSNGAIEWWRRREDMPAVLAQSFLVCLPSSYGEGLPKVLLEAAASGRPLVATDIPGCREIVRDRENGLLIRPKDFSGLASAIAELLGDRARAEMMGKRSREIVEKEFHSEVVVDQTLMLYRQLLQQVRKSHR